MLKMELFGPGRASYCGQSLVGFPNQQAHLVLCYLLLNHHYPQHRDRLSSVFWSEHPTQVSRKNLRNAIWRLRQAFEGRGASLDDYLLIDDECVSFVGSSPYWLDVEEFEKLVTSCQNCPGQDLTLEQAIHLEKAVSLYLGDLLDGIYEDWCLYDRERLSLLYLNALGKMMAFHEAHGAYELGLSYGERILFRDDTREKIHLQMMRLHLLMGDRQAALAQYKRCAQILRDELGIQPMKETTQLYQQILSNQPSSVSPLCSTHHPHSATPEMSQQVAEHALGELTRLKAVIDDARSELHRIEIVVSKVLVVSR